MYCSDFNEQGQVSLQFIGTFLCSLITFVSTTFFAISLSSCPVPPSPTLSLFEEVWIFHWPVSTELFSIPLLLFFFSIASLHVLTGPRNKDSISIYPSFVCVFPSLHSYIWPQPAEYLAVCLVLLLLPAERSGLGLDRYQAVWGLVSTMFYLVPKRVSACTQTMFYCRTCPHGERNAEMTFKKSSHSGTGFNYFFHECILAVLLLSGLLMFNIMCVCNYRHYTAFM